MLWLTILAIGNVFYEFVYLAMMHHLELGARSLLMIKYEMGIGNMQHPPFFFEIYSMLIIKGYFYAYITGMQVMQHFTLKKEYTR